MMCFNFNQVQKTILEMQLAIVDLKCLDDWRVKLPSGNTLMVKRNGALFILKEDGPKEFGYFMVRLGGDSVSYLFVYKVGEFDIEEKIAVCDEKLSEDLPAFAIKLACFFDKHPDYKYTRDHYWDVLEPHSFADGVRAKQTPLAKAGFKIV